jgi:hypothetical protein
MNCIAWALASHPQSPAGSPLNRFDIGLSISLGGLRSSVLLPSSRKLEVVRSSIQSRAKVAKVRLCGPRLPNLVSLSVTSHLSFLLITGSNADLHI